MQWYSKSELAGLEASLKLIRTSRFKRTIGSGHAKKTITELLKIHQFDSVDSVQAILSKYGMSSWKRQNKTVCR
jgi:hypothetical protein